MYHITYSDVITKITAYEKDSTITAYQTSLTIKSIIAQLINSVVIPIIIYDSMAYNKNGLASIVLVFSITNAILPPIIIVVNPVYLFSVVQMFFKRRASAKLGIRQS
jgi:hypothetical protein